jgi:hypothetical protein
MIDTDFGQVGQQHIADPGPASTSGSYDASPIKRTRATKSEMKLRADFLIDYAAQHGPVTVRGLYYQAEVHGVPGITKSDSDYSKVQRQVLALRRSGDLPYSDIADATRWMRKPTTHSSIEEALSDTAKFYRKRLWDDRSDRVEIWLEKDALAGVIYPVTSKYDVPLMVTRGFSSETFCFEAVEAYDIDKITHVYYLGDFDRAGQDAAKSLERSCDGLPTSEASTSSSRRSVLPSIRYTTSPFPRALPSVCRQPTRNGPTTSRASWTRWRRMICACSLRT